MGGVKGFASYGGQFRPPGPPVFGLNAKDRIPFEDQHNELLYMSEDLTDEHKMISDYWLPTLEFGNPPSHFMFFGMNALITENRNLEDSIKLLMLLGNSQFDAGIGAWDAKRHFDSSRPITAIRCMHTGTTIRAWGGPYQGTVDMDGGSFLPYQYINFVSPPFSEYVSGHSTFAMAGAVVLENFFGSEFVGPNSVTWRAGESATEPKIDDPSDPLYMEGFTDTPNQGQGTPGYYPRSDTTLSWDSWREAAEESGFSRLYGGVHIHDGNVHALELGEKIGEVVWNKGVGLFNGQKDPCKLHGDYYSDSSSSDSSMLTISMMFVVMFVFGILI